MSMAPYTAAAFTNNAGVANIAALATIEVRRESDGALAAIWQDSEQATPLANPFAADANGRFTFYAPGIQKGYQVKVTSGVNIYTLHNQPIGTAAQLDATSFWNGTMLERFQRRGRMMAALNFSL